MSFGVWVEVPCARCSATGEGLWCFDARVPRRAIERMLKRDGWVRRDDDWLCRPCSKDDLPDA